MPFSGRGAAIGRDLFGREADPVGTDDWSVLVEEFLRVNGALPIVKRNEPELRRTHRVIGLLRDHASYLGVPAGISAAAFSNMRNAGGTPIWHGIVLGL